MSPRSVRPPRPGRPTKTPDASAAPAWLGVGAEGSGCTWGMVSLLGALPAGDGRLRAARGGPRPVRGFSCWACVTIVQRNGIASKCRDIRPSVLGVRGVRPSASILLVSGPHRRTLIVASRRACLISLTAERIRRLYRSLFNIARTGDLDGLPRRMRSLRRQALVERLVQRRIGAAHSADWWRWPRPISPPTAS